MDVFKVILLFVFFVLFTILIIPPIYAIEPLDRAPAASLRLVNVSDNQVIEHLNVNQRVLVTADITNNQEDPQKFVFIVQIKNDENVIISLGWITGTLNPNQSLSTARSWTPDQPGTYLAEIFVWESLENQDALSESLSISIITS
ncbi:MAG: hypothetical protein NPMRTH1_410004 [Nitrosopumilales archaeon]|nr:MAG: hypothetical protein NPMRTH1_410004 [Nitrosopumilales archaeon]